MDGLIVVDKPAGCTSHDVVLRIRRIHQIQKAGHCGTLDPDATGILLVAIGRGVRFFPYLSGQDKTYEAVIRLGFSTETYDASGRPISVECRKYPSELELLEAVRKWEGEVHQIPPPFSAKKVGGRPMHRLAREGRKIQGRPVRVNIREFRLTEYAPPEFSCRVICSSGTYIRSLAHDLGRDLGCGAHLRSLRRTAIGPYSVQNAWSVESIEQEARGGGAGYLIPLEELLPQCPKLSLTPEAERLVRNGVPIPMDLDLRTSLEGGSTENPALARLFGRSGKLLALARLSPGRDRLLPFLVISHDP